MVLGNKFRFIYNAVDGMVQSYWAVLFKEPHKSRERSAHQSRIMRVLDTFFLRRMLRVRDDRTEQTRSRYFLLRPPVADGGVSRSN